MSRLEQPIFVVGCPRSGTTLVQCMLSASSQAFSLPETHFFSWVLPVANLAPADLIAEAQLDQLRGTFAIEAELALPESFWSGLRRRLPLRAVDVFIEVVEQYQPAPGLRAIEKTPRHVLHLQTIGSAFPDARFVNVVRDSVDVASSLLGVPFEASRSVLSYAQRWTESIHAARAYGHAYPGRLQTVVYEQLVHAPEAVMRKLCAFVNLPYEPEMLDEFGREAARNIGRGEVWKSDIKSGVILDRSGAWRGRLTPGQAWLVAKATRPLRSAFGYPDRPRASAESILAAMLGEARVRFREARRSTGVVGAARHAGSVVKSLSMT